MTQRKTVAREIRKPAVPKPRPAAAGRATAPARAAKPAPVISATSATSADGDGKTAKDAKKHKLVRDSFTMPRADFDLIHALKERALGFKRPAKKSELLRAGLQALAALDDAALKARLERLVSLKPGRPKQKV